MPIMDGKQACIHIRQHDKTIPIIALTANVMAKEVKDYDSVGFSAHLGKPFEMNYLYTLLHRYLVSA